MYFKLKFIFLILTIKIKYKDGDMTACFRIEDLVRFIDDFKVER